MADNDPKVPPPAPVLLVEDWNSISQGNLGLKAVYWKDDEKTGFEFRAIVGWITFSSRRVTDVVPTNGFAAVVVSDNWFPVLAGTPPRYVGIAPEDATDEEIRARISSPNAATNLTPGRLN